MKKTIILSIMLFFSVVALAQDIEIINDKYYKAEMLYTGVHKEYYETGELLSKINIVNGDIDGQQDIFFPNGKKKEQRSYDEGLKDGTWIKWNEAGVKIAEANYRIDSKHGEWKIWDDNGVLRYEMFYRKGKKTGTWIMYDENGAETNRKKY